MTTNDFNRAFQDVSASQLAPPSADPGRIVEQMLRRDQRRTRFLAGLSLLFWLIGVAGMLLLLLGLNRLVIFIRIADNMPWNAAPAHVQPLTAPLPLYAAPTRSISSAPLEQMLWGTSLIHHSIPFVAASLLAVMLAALFTVLLVFSSRTATLNRINISLARLSEQLRTGAPAVGPLPPMYERYQMAPRPRPWLSWLGVLVICLIACAVLWRNGNRAWSGYARMAPYDAVRWHGDTPQVRVAGTWYELDAIDDLPVDQIVAFSKSRDVSAWQKHFEEDLVELMTQMNHQPGRRVTLLVKELTTGQTQALDVPMTEENRDALWNAREGGESGR